MVITLLYLVRHREGNPKDELFILHPFVPHIGRRAIEPVLEYMRPRSKTAQSTALIPSLAILFIWYSPTGSHNPSNSDDSIVRGP